jgi:hypothetical protein
VVALVVLGWGFFRPPPHFLVVVGRWHGGCGIWVLEVVVLVRRRYWWWWDLIAVVRCWDADVLDMTLLVCDWCRVCLVFLILDSLTVFKFVEICRILWVAGGFEIYWDLQVSCIWLNSTASMLTVSSLSTGVHQLSTQWAVFWILMGRALLIRVRV